MLISILADAASPDRDKITLRPDTASPARFRAEPGKMVCGGGLCALYSFPRSRAKIQIGRGLLLRHARSGGCPRSKVGKFRPASDAGSQLSLTFAYAGSRFDVSRCSRHHNRVAVVKFHKLKRLVYGSKNIVLFCVSLQTKWSKLGFDIARRTYFISASSAAARYSSR